jgi:hypothetical protein
VVQDLNEEGGGEALSGEGGSPINVRELVRIDSSIDSIDTLRFWHRFCQWHTAFPNVD